jgi:hypothetical protein
MSITTSAANLLRKLVLLSRTENALDSCENPANTRGDRVMALRKKLVEALRKESDHTPSL